LILFSGVVPRLTSLYAPLIILRIPALFLFSSVCHDFVLISGVVGVFGVFAGFVEFGVSGVVFEFIHGLFDLCLRGLVVVLQRLAKSMGDISINVDVEVIEFVLTEI
jgi:hypothetical protein